MTTITRDLYDQLADEFDLRDDYSGRGMFGDRCIAVDGDIGDLIRFVATIQREDEWDDHLTEELARTARTDTMGAGLVFYFPGITVEG